ncbi:MAG: hypothetical protein QF619_10865, partial [Candidatus Binatia bacterium]|nr:hypothetical protein [Candidatus Binatia bacterium]
LFIGLGYGEKYVKDSKTIKELFHKDSVSMQNAKRKAKNVQWETNDHSRSGLILPFAMCHLHFAMRFLFHGGSRAELS